MKKARILGHNHTRREPLWIRISWWQVHIPQPSRQSKRHMTNLEAFALLSMNQGKPKRGTSQPSFQIGDYVYFRYRNQYGTVIDINGGLYMVRFGGGRVDSFSADQLKKE